MKKATNFNVTNAIDLGVNDNTEESGNAARTQRRANPVAATERKSTPSSETSTGNSRYKIIK